MRGRLIALIVTIAISLISTQAALSNSYKQQIAHNKAVTAQAIRIYFPPNKQDLMLKVAGCETGETWFPQAHNSSGASGEFQVLSSHNGTTFSYNGISITVDSSRLFDPYYNTLVAYVMSSGGTNLGPWISSEGCWIN